MTAFTTVTHPALRGRTREQASVQARRRPFLPGEATGSFWILADAEGNEACVCTWQDRD